METLEPKSYSESVKATVAAARKFAEEKRAEGWTREDAAESLRKMLESDTAEN